MKKWLKRIGIGALIVIVVVCTVTYIRFAQWRHEVRSLRTLSATVRSFRPRRGQSNTLKLRVDPQFF